MLSPCSLFSIVISANCFSFNTSTFSHYFKNIQSCGSSTDYQCITMNGQGACVTDGLPPHVHELMGQASAHLLSHNNQKVLGQGADELDNSVTRDSSEGTAPNEHGNMLATRLEKHSLLRGQGKNLHTKALAVPAGSGYSYAHASRTRFGDQQTDPYRRNQIQVNYLDCLASRIPTLGSLHDELQVKEELRVLLTKIAQKALEGHAQRHGYYVGPKIIDLKCIGSLRNGFMLPNTDLDLVVRTHASSFPKPLEKEYPQILEKAFLDAGFGVHFVSNTKISVIKSFEESLQNPLDALKERHEGQQNKGAEQSFGVQPNPEFSYSGVCVRCGIDFSGRLALYTTEFLRCYALCDERVRLVVVFVKMWTKIRKINDPHNGTMCSYGYILMVIHYLMNVAHPPLVPNLQIVQRPFSRHMESANVNGHEVRFFNDESELRAISKRNRFSGNQQSVGGLLRGFFAYYGSNSPQSGFHWVNNTVSIRTQGGIIPKHEKGWNTAKTDGDGSRLRFLIAIEDPFEHEHNVARNVTEAGVSAIRAEFNRAQTIINRIQEIPGSGWEWRTDEGDVGQDFLAELKDQSSLHSVRRFKPPGSRANTGPKHLDCAPQFCTAQMDLNGSHGIESPRYPVVKPGSYRSCAKTKPLKISGKDAVSARKENGQVHTEFEIQANNIAAKTMECLLHVPEAQDAKLPGYNPQPLNQPSNRSSMVSHVTSMDSVGDAPRHDMSPPLRAQFHYQTSQFCGVTLDSRQFHGPGAIRNRYSIAKHHRVLGSLKYPENSEPIASDTETVADTSDVPGSELLADLPFYE